MSLAVRDWELMSLGKDYVQSLEDAQMLTTARCDHENKVNAAKCVVSIIGWSNMEHFFVATQDADVRKKFRQIPGLLVIYALRNALFLQQPSIYHHEFVKSTEEKRLHMSDAEYLKLENIKLKDKLANSTDSPSAEDDSGKELVTATRENQARQRLGVAN